MKKIISLISLVLVAILVTGCGGASSGTITCKSEARGTDPTTVTYEKYVVENNKVVEYTKYNTLKFSNDYLNKVPMETILEVYNKDTEITVEKVDGNTLKTTVKAPINYYTNIESDNMIETIRASLEDNEFSIYKYTCEIE